MNRIFRILSIFLISTVCQATATEFDLTVVGSVMFSDGIGRQSIALLDLLKDDLQINFIPTKLQNSPKDIRENILEIILNTDKTAGKVCLLEDPLWYIFQDTPAYKLMPESQIKIAYSMFETDVIPATWVKILNKEFDLVVVPDKYLAKVYEDSGVTIPVFELAIPLYLDDFLRQEPKKMQQDFVFGCSATCCPRKNTSLLVQAFAEEFGTTDHVFLKLNCRKADIEVFNHCQDLLKTYQVTNIAITENRLSHVDYVDFMKQLDCYVSISKGEGFSIPPREALALQLPCILSNNTAQTTICETGYVLAIPSKIKEPSDYKHYMGEEDTGNFFNCELSDVKKGLREMYQNYAHYKKMAVKGRKWVLQYTFNKIKLKYLSLIKPQTVILGKNNTITNSYLMTNSATLYNKYIKAFGLEPYQKNDIND